MLPNSASSAGMNVSGFSSYVDAKSRGSLRSGENIKKRILGVNIKSFVEMFIPDADRR